MSTDVTNGFLRSFQLLTKERTSIAPDPEERVKTYLGFLGLGLSRPSYFFMVRMMEPFSRPRTNIRVNSLRKPSFSNKTIADLI